LRAIGPKTGSHFSDCILTFTISAPGKGHCVLDQFDSLEFRLLRLSARFRPEPGTALFGPDTPEILAVVDQLMSEGYWSDEFLDLSDPEYRLPERQRPLGGFLSKLNWRPLDEEGRFRFLTALYARIGQTDDVLAYYAIIRWMDDVGGELHEHFSDKFVADRIGAHHLYACYYSFSKQTGGDLIPGVDDPRTHNWHAEGIARPRRNFADWLVWNPKDFRRFLPIEIGLLKRLKV
jgi:hypothetical protein